MASQDPESHLPPSAPADGSTGTVNPAGRADVQVNGAGQPHPTSSTLRSNPLRRRSVSDEELVEIRAAQRTFEGAYIRTALGQFGFALVVLRIFTNEFYSIGALFAAYGAGVLAIAIYRRHHSKNQFFLEEIGVAGSGNHIQKFRTSGNVVLIMTAFSLMAYVAMLVLILRLGS